VSAGDIFSVVPSTEIRQLRDESPNNLATLCYKSVEKLVKAVDTSCRTHQDQQIGKSGQNKTLKCLPCPLYAQQCYFLHKESTI